MTHHPDDAVDGPGFATLSVASMLSETAARAPDRAALHFSGATISYGRLWAETCAYAGALRRRGIGRGDRVAVLVPNVPDFVRVYYAVLALGAVVVPVHLLFKAREIEHVLRDSGADLAVVAAPVLDEALPAAWSAGVPIITVLAAPEADGSNLPQLEVEAAAATPIRRVVPVHPMDAATILYTSGTTGTPKGAVGSHLAMVEQIHATLLDAIEIRPDDVVFGGLPLFHAFGQSAVLNLAFRRGASIILLPRFHPDEALDLLILHRATVFTAVPTMFVGMIAAVARRDERPPLRFAISGGAALPVTVLEAFSAAFGAQVHEGYGLTEAGPTVAVNSVYEPVRPGTVGRPLWGMEVAIAQPEVEGRIELLESPDALGEIVVRGPNLFKGYLGHPAESAEAVVDGWLRTGDLGTLDRDGILTIVDRLKDLVVRNGYNVYPTEVESVLMQHPDVAVAAVFGLPDEVHGQEVHAAVVARQGHVVDPDQVVDFTRPRLAAFKYPRVIHIMEALPVGASGKVLKRELVAIFTATHPVTDVGPGDR